MSKMTTVRFKDDEHEVIKKVSSMYGESVTSFMRKAILDRVEDSLDYKEAIASKKESNGETVSRKEIMNRLGL